MSLFERIINTILFEISAIIVGIIGVRFFTETDATHAAGVTVVMSLMAATWAFIYNYGFDRIFTGPREDRTPLQRIIHAVDLEGGLLLATVPFIAYALNMSLWEAFVTDISLTLLILVDAYIFNYIYNHVRLRFVPICKEIQLRYRIICISSICTPLQVC